MSDQLFPYWDLKGLTFSSFKTPSVARRIQRSVSGRELVVSDYANPIWNFRLTFSFLRDYPVGLIQSELRELMNFYNDMVLFDDTFLFLDRDDYAVTDEPIGTGDGVTQSFQLVRRLAAGGFVESIIAPASIVNVKLDGIATPDYTYSGSTGIITFTGAPIVGQAITASFTYYFRCRFTDDALEFARMYYKIWSVKELRFRSVVL
jgi:uncharacterized protein (TIGR02217 family)